MMMIMMMITIMMMIKMTENDADDLLLRCLLSLYSAVITKPGAVTRAGETTEVRKDVAGRIVVGLEMQPFWNRNAARLQFHL